MNGAIRYFMPKHRVRSGRRQASATARHALIDLPVKRREVGVPWEALPA